MPAKIGRVIAGYDQLIANWYKYGVHRAVADDVTAIASSRLDRGWRTSSNLWLRYFDAIWCIWHHMYKHCT
jgi:hypothetical protein